MGAKKGRPPMPAAAPIPSPRALAAVALQQLRRAADARRRDYLAGYAPTRLRTLGAAGAAIGVAVRALRAALRRRPAADVLATARALCHTRVFEACLAAYLVLDHRADAHDALGVRELPALAPALDNWVSVDTFGVCVAGQAWRRGRLTDDDVHGWARSPDRWRRRLALVCTVALNQRSHGGAGDVPRTLAVAETAVADRDD
ncbi:MAG TPA: DNA alkylation repair protein, partial [Myxococcota bacterium]|nr:DNA alkylation repair protein [Myxococcota bacterium]